MDVTQCHWVHVSRRFGAIWRLYFQGWRGTWRLGRDATRRDATPRHTHVTFQGTNSLALSFHP